MQANIQIMEPLPTEQEQTVLQTVQEKHQEGLHTTGNIKLLTLNYKEKHSKECFFYVGLIGVLFGFCSGLYYPKGQFAEQNPNKTQTKYLDKPI